MAIQNRRGAYVDLNPAKAVPGELLVVQSGDPNTTDGKAVYITFASGDVKMLAAKSDVGSMINEFAEDIAQQLEDTVKPYAERAEEAAQSLEVDNTLTKSGQPADAKKTGDEIGELKADLKKKSGLSEEAKLALLACFEHVTWIDEHGQNYYDDLQDALYPDTGLSRITAVFEQGSLVVYTSTPFNDLKPYLTVTGYYKDGTTEHITDYALSGTLEVGTSVITATKEGKTATFNVTVSQPYWDYEWNASSKALPEGMTATYYDFTTEPGFLYVETPNMNFNYIGNQRIAIECKMYTINRTLQQISYRNNPQITLTSVNEQKGCKLIGVFGNSTTNPNGNLSIGINGVNTILGDVAAGMEMHQYDLTEESGACSLVIDGSPVTLTQNEGTSQYLKASGIISSTLDDPLYGIMVIKSIKYKKL